MKARNILILLFLSIVLISGCSDNSNNENFKNGVVDYSNMNVVPYREEIEISDIAIFEKDNNNCEKISEKREKEECYTNYAKFSMNERDCNKINDVDVRNSCKIYVKEVLDTVAECEKIEDTLRYSRSTCFEDIATDIKNVELCKKATSYLDMEYMCIFYIAQDTRNEEFCSYLSDEPMGEYNTYRDSCYKKMAFVKKDEKICLLVESRNAKDLCYAEVASRTINAEICDKIIDTKMKKECKTNITYLAEKDRIEHEKATAYFQEQDEKNYSAYYEFMGSEDIDEYCNYWEPDLKGKSYLICPINKGWEIHFGLKRTENKFATFSNTSLYYRNVHIYKQSPNLISSVPEYEEISIHVQRICISM